MSNPSGSESDKKKKKKKKNSDSSDSSKESNKDKDKEPLMQMKRCSACQKVYYCSRQCQEWDWRMGGHKLQCKVADNQNNSGGAGNATEVVKDLN